MISAMGWEISPYWGTVYFPFSNPPSPVQQAEPPSYQRLPNQKTYERKYHDPYLQISGEEDEKEGHEKDLVLLANKEMDAPAASPVVFPPKKQATSSPAKSMAPPTGTVICTFSSFVK